MKKGELELIDYAIYFATKAHTGQKRKTEQDVDIDISEIKVYHGKKEK